MAQNNKLHGAKRILSAVTAALIAATTLTAMPAMAEDALTAVDENIVTEADGAVSGEWGGAAATRFAGGTGTQADPYQIVNGAQLAFLANQVDAGTTYKGYYFKLTMDVLLNSEDRLYDDPKVWNPIGSADYAFEGTFDGNGHEVIGMYFSTSNSYYGLFAKNSGTIKNLSVTDGSLNSTGTGQYVGSVCGYNTGTIIDCSSDSSITSSSGSGDYYGGGICGYNTGTLEGCTNDGKLSITGSSTRYQIGGICGRSSGTINDCHNTGKVYTAGTVNSVGGICGYNTGTIRACANTADVDGDLHVGGICGTNYKAIRTSFNTGIITIRTAYGGGICGSSHRSDSIADILDCHNSGKVTGQYSHFGGICGYLDGYLIKDCYNTGTVYANYNTKYNSSYKIEGAGGICGYVNKGNINSCYNTGSVYSWQYNSNSTYYDKACSGGIAGYLNSSANISDCYNRGYVYGEETYGGIYGYSNSSGNSITYCISYDQSRYGGTGGSATPSNIYTPSTPSEKYTSDDIIEELGFDSDIWAKKPNSGLYRYYINLKGIDADDDWNYVTDLLAPTNVKATANSGEVIITWDAAQGATSYRVYRASTATGARTLLKATNTNSYTDISVEENKTYYYYVAAYNSELDKLSAYSAVASIKVPVRPAKPTSVKAVSGGGNVTVTWNAVPNATSYRVFRSTSLTGTRELQKVRTSTYYIDTKATTGTTYYYWVVAYNANNGQKSVYSASTSAKVVNTFAKNVAIKNSSVTASTVTLSWDIVPGATSYRIYRRNDSGTRKLIATQSMTEFTDTGLTKGKAYKYEIRAYSAKTGALTNYSPLESVRPIAAPTITGGNIKGKLTWAKNLYATSYRVYRANSLTGAKTLLTATQDLTYTDTSAVDGKLYYYFVAAYDNTTDTLSQYSAAKAIQINK